MQECLGQSQIELTALALLDPVAYSKKTEEPYIIRKHLTVVHLISSESGMVEGVRFLEEIEKLPSFYLHRIYLAPGDQ